MHFSWEFFTSIPILILELNTFTSKRKGNSNGSPKTLPKNTKFVKWWIKFKYSLDENIHEIDEWAKMNDFFNLPTFGG